MQCWLSVIKANFTVKIAETLHLLHNVFDILKCSQITLCCRLTNFQIFYLFFDKLLVVPLKKTYNTHRGNINFVCTFLFQN